MFASLWLGLFGCGSLADGSYLGESLFSLEGTVVTEGLDTSYADQPVGVAMLWTLDLGEGGDAGAAAQAAVVRTAFPARYTLDLYQPPPLDRRIRLFGEGDFLGVVGLPVIFVDQDGDGAWNRDGEPVIGGSYSSAVVYSETMPSWFTELAGDRVSHGFVAVGIGGELCEPESLGEALRLDEAPLADLYVGTVRPLLEDWDCDGASDEWSEEQWVNVENCPSQEIIDHECAELQHNLDEAVAPEDYERLRDILSTDPYWTECLRVSCPEVIGGIEAG